MVSRLSSAEGKDEVADLRVEADEKIEYSRNFNYQLFSRLFDEHQRGFIPFISENIDACFDVDSVFRSTLVESKVKRGLFQRRGYIREQEEKVRSAREFCKFFSSKALDVSPLHYSIPELRVSVPPRAPIPSERTEETVSAYIDECVAAIDANVSQAMNESLKVFREMLALVEGLLLQIDAKIENGNLELHESANKRQIYDMLQMLEIKAHSLKRAILFLESFISAV